jgi:hypothetical protein
MALKISSREWLPMSLLPSRDSDSVRRQRGDRQLAWKEAQRTFALRTKDFHKEPKYLVFELYILYLTSIKSCEKVYNTFYAIQLLWFDKIKFILLQMCICRKHC